MRHSEKLTWFEEIYQYIEGKKHTILWLIKGSYILELHMPLNSHSYILVSLLCLVSSS